MGFKNVIYTSELHQWIVWMHPVKVWDNSGYTNIYIKYTQSSIGLFYLRMISNSNTNKSWRTDGSKVCLFRLKQSEGKKKTGLHKWG